MGIVLVGIGAFIASAGIFNWEWFLDSQKRRYLISFETMFGRNGARVAYVIIGLVLIVAGIANV